MLEREGYKPEVNERLDLRFGLPPGRRIWVRVLMWEACKLELLLGEIQIFARDLHRRRIILSANMALLSLHGESRQRRSELTRIL
jgi:hypothetical protein